MRQGKKPEYRKKQDTAERKREEACRRAENVTIIAALNRVVDDQHARNDEASRNERSKRCRELITIAGIYLAAFVAIGAIIFTHIDSSDQIDTLGKQVGVMQRQLTVMETDQRPWVGLDGIDPSRTNDFFYLVKLANAGKSPAMSARVIIIGGAGDCTEFAVPRQPCEGDRCTFNNVEMLPNVPLGARIPRFGEPAPTPGGEVCLIARVDYEDTDGKPHKTGICLIQSPAGQRSCAEPNSNYAD
jgi:hypothetical protein